MNYNTPRTTKFKNGELIPTAEETTYLGARVRMDHNVRKEVAKKISSCFATLKRLNLFWNNQNCPTKFRLQVFDAVVRSKLVYGLESTMITSALMKKLETLQLKGIRKILGLTTTFVNRANTNEVVFQQANDCKNPRKLDGKDIVPYGTYIRRKQHVLLAHTIRAPDEDPVRQATIDPGTQLPVNVGKRRVGRPRDNWTWTNLEELYVLNNKGTKEQFKADKWQGAWKVAELALNREIRC